MQRISWLFVFALLGCLNAGLLQAQANMPERTVLFAKPTTLTDNRIVTRVIRVEFPVGFKTPEHIHKGPGPRYILSGKVRIVDQEGTHIYDQGEVFWETGEPMIAENAAEGKTVLLIFEMTPREKAAPNRWNKITIRPQ
ncbi:cupin domain-containing protein [Methylohalobius crimeensis]|uniref:cupin domain-containing protein n=1 Tax=Methylohalobius crimeensis TaxID=244365 RepID=UPI0003B4D528|nr:cupin domain-containing protein [Methylohalobius crimeensis]